FTSMAASTVIMSSLNLKPSSPLMEKTSARDLPSLARSSSSFTVRASGVKKIKTDTPYGTGGGMSLRNGLDASGRKPKGKGVYQFTDKYGANVDGYSPIYSPEEWSESGDVYAGGKTGLLIWAVTLGAVLLGGALLVYNTSALSQ
ncbi:photosystem II protein PsbR, partial [Ralstonia pseudosolanacearum]|uniref:photosystem II protein PsbR n=1 Tax=Ralstonia pseudosolanacearum TaxID=1310165 RepID=UPI003D1748B5